MHMKVGEVIDRYTIGKLYSERESQNSDRADLDCLRHGFHDLVQNHPEVPLHELEQLMYRINGFIWDFESPIHTGKMDMDPMMAGVLALRVRKLNVMRTSLSKIIDQLVGE